MPDHDKTAADRQLQLVSLGKPDVIPIDVKQRNVYTFVQTIPVLVLNSSSTPGLEVDGGLFLALNMLDGVAAIQGFFDQYRLLQATYTFEPRYNMSTNGGTVLGTLTTALDYDDAALTSAALLRQKETCMVTPAFMPHKRTFRPHVANAVYSGTFASFSNITMEWIDSASPNVQHFGLKFALTGNGNAIAAAIYDVYARIVIQGRQVQ
jgi:hypothetical protein